MQARSPWSHQKSLASTCHKLPLRFCSASPAAGGEEACTLCIKSHLKRKSGHVQLPSQWVQAIILGFHSMSLSNLPETHKSSEPHKSRNFTCRPPPGLPTTFLSSLQPHSPERRSHSYYMTRQCYRSYLYPRMISDLVGVTWNPPAEE